MRVVKKDGSLAEFNPQKIISAVEKSANRAMYELTDEDKEKLVQLVREKIGDKDKVDIADLHIIVENSLDEIDEKTARAYRDYRNYKTEFVKILDNVWKKAKSLEYIGDVSNANTDSTLVATQRSLTFGQLNKEFFQKFFLNQAERDAINDGYIYIHDMKDRLSTFNCCNFDIANVLKGGFECANIYYSEPKTLDVAFDVISDVTMIAAAQEYGGFTLPEVDTVLSYYADKSYQKYRTEYYNIVQKEHETILKIIGLDNPNLLDTPEKIKCFNDLIEHWESLADEYAENKVRRDYEQGFQSWEYRFNTVGSSRGDYPFIACSFGIDQSRFGKMATEVILKTRMGGQGRKGFKKPVLFPKLTFLYDENLHGEGKPLEYLFDIAIQCSSKTLYPDYLSLSGEGYIPSIYKKYGKAISLMGKIAIAHLKPRELINIRCA